VLRPCARRGASGRESESDDAGFGFSPSDPAVEDPYDVAASTADADADDCMLPIVEDPFERAATTGLGEGADDEADTDLVLLVPTVEEPHEVAASVPHMSAGEDPHDLTATTDLSADADADEDLVLRVLFVEDPFERVAGADANLVLRVPIIEETHEVTALVTHMSADEDSHELTATTDLCVVPRDDAGLVRHVPPTVEETPDPEVAATTGLSNGAHDDRIVYPSRLTQKDLDEFETMDFSRSAIDARFQLKSKEAKAAVKGAVGGVLSPLRELVHDLRNLDSVFDVEEFQIGMPFAAIMTCMGMYQLWRLSPSTCIDVAMHYAFYKLSVIAADVRRRGFSPDWIIRIKLGQSIYHLALIVSYVV
jgi:hypothetical protein